MCPRSFPTFLQCFPNISNILQTNQIIMKWIKFEHFVTNGRKKIEQAPSKSMQIWEGCATPPPLPQHAVQGKLTGADTALARWLVFCHTHCDLPLDYRWLSSSSWNSRIYHSCIIFYYTFCFFRRYCFYSCLKFLLHHPLFSAPDFSYLLQGVPAYPRKAGLRPGQLSATRRRGGKVQWGGARVRQPLCGVCQET